MLPLVFNLAQMSKRFGRTLAPIARAGKGAAQIGRGGPASWESWTRYGAHMQATAPPPGAMRRFFMGTTGAYSGGKKAISSMKYLGRYSIGGGILRAGAYGMVANALSQAAGQLEDIPGYEEMAPATQGLLRFGLKAGSIYAGYRGVKSFVRGAVGSTQTLLPRGKLYTGSAVGIVPGTLEEYTTRTRLTKKESYRLFPSSRGAPRRRGLHHLGKPYGKGQRRAVLEGSAFKGVPYSALNINPNYGMGLIGGFEKLARMPGELAIKAVEQIPKAAVGAAKLPWSMAHGAAAYTGLPFRIGGRFFQGAARGIITGPPTKGIISKGLTGGIASSSATALTGFGNMKHPYAGAFGVAIASGGLRGVGEHNERKRLTYGAPMMKARGSRSYNNFSPNVTLTAHSMNRGMR